MKTSKISRFIIVSILFLIFVILAYTHTSWILNKQDFPLSTFVYSSFLIWWAVTIISFKLKSGFSLWTGFTLFTIGSTFAVLSLFNFSEPFFRFSFILFVVGLAHSLIEYKSSDE